MQRNYTLLLSTCFAFLVASTLFAQETRFIDPIFEEGEPELNVTYA